MEEETRVLPIGRELDVRIAELFFNSIHWDKEFSDFVYKLAGEGPAAKHLIAEMRIPFYSRDIASAIDALEEFAEEHYFQLNFGTNHDPRPNRATGEAYSSVTYGRYGEGAEGIVEGETLAHAICLTLLAITNEGG